jgi:hypothetical protein
LASTLNQTQRNGKQEQAKNDGGLSVFMETPYGLSATAGK